MHGGICAVGLIATLCKIEDCSAIANFTGYCDKHTDWVGTLWIISGAIVVGLSIVSALTLCLIRKARKNNVMNVSKGVLPRTRRVSLPGFLLSGFLPVTAIILSLLAFRSYRQQEKNSRELSDVLKNMQQTKKGRELEGEKDQTDEKVREKNSPKTIYIRTKNWYKEQLEYNNLHEVSFVNTDSGVCIDFYGGRQIVYYKDADRFSWPKSMAKGFALKLYKARVLINQYEKENNLPLSGFWCP